MDIVKNGFNAFKALTVTDFLKVKALTVNNLHSPTICCLLSDDGLLYK